MKQLDPHLWDSHLVERFTPLALAVARRWGRSFPWLADDFASDAGLALWKCARAHDPARGSFEGLVRVAVRRALSRRLRTERAQNPVAFRPGSPLVGDATANPAALLPAPGPPVGAVLEAEELVSRLLPASRRHTIERHYREGATFAAIAAEEGVTASAVGRRVREGLADLAAVCEGM